MPSKFENLGDLDRATAYMLYRAARRSQFHLLRCLRDWGTSITPEQWFTLFRLESRGPLPMAALADPAIEDYPNITRLVAGLERQGLVRRSPDPQDGRVKRVTLTAKGRTVIRRIHARVPEERRKMFAGITSKELAVFERVLSKIEDNLATI